MLKYILKLIVSFVTSLIGGIMFGIMGLIIGSTIGGNFGFPAFGGNVGYESGGVFFAIVGISLGSLLGVMLISKLRKQIYNLKKALIIIVFTIGISVSLFDYNMSTIIELLILFLPPLSLTALTRDNKPTPVIM